MDTSNKQVIKREIPNRKDCPGCASRKLTEGPLIKGQPTMMHSLCTQKSEAISLGVGAIRLKECKECGLIFNGAFDSALICYDTEYDNRQGFSLAFREHLSEVATVVEQNCKSQNRRILEVGCGKGEFLRLLVSRGAKDCVGYDTSCPDANEIGNHGIEFFRSYANPDDIRSEYDVIVCRHVVEHVPEISQFIELLLSLSRKAGNAVVVIETPAFEWVAENACFWDYFYEHCNYFTMSALAFISQDVGFEIVNHRRVFGEQYQLLVLRPAATIVSPENLEKPLLQPFIKQSEIVLKNLQQRIEDLRSEGKWAIWGAGAKGVSLAGRLDATNLAYVVDSNPAKAGKWLPGSGVPISSPDRASFGDLSLVVIANPIYENEIKDVLTRRGFGGKILVV